MTTSVWLGFTINAHPVRNSNPDEGHFLCTNPPPQKDLKTARPPCGRVERQRGEGRSVYFTRGQTAAIRIAPLLA